MRSHPAGIETKVIAGPLAQVRMSPAVPKPVKKGHKTVIVDGFDTGYTPAAWAEIGRQQRYDYWMRRLLKIKADRLL